MFRGSAAFRRLILQFKDCLALLRARTLVRDLKSNRKSFSPRIVVDVGANVGQISAFYLRIFPKAEVFALEPAPSSFNVLAKRLRNRRRLHAMQLALDESSGEAMLVDVPCSTGNHLLSAGEAPRESVKVEKLSGDDFVRRHGISKIDFLKIDTEGYDLRVLAGFSETLKAGRIEYIQVECTTSYDNDFHVHLERFMRFLDPFGYRLFGLYELQRHIYATDQPLNGIWFGNAVFVKEVPNPRLRTDGIHDNRGTRWARQSEAAEP